VMSRASGRPLGRIRDSGARRGAIVAQLLRAVAGDEDTSGTVERWPLKDEPR
jgi:hypothetical protein